MGVGGGGSGDDCDGAAPHPGVCAYRRAAVAGLGCFDNITEETDMPTARRHFIATGIAGTAALLGLPGCASMAGWTPLLDAAAAPTMDGWSALGEGNWRFVDGTLEGRAGKLGYLLSKQDYADFELKAEFWADADCNSGIFLRCQSRAVVNAGNSYEVNIFDKRPDPSYGTAAIVDFAKAPQPYPQAANRWNTFDVSAKGDRVVVVFNGQQTVDMRNDKFKTGPIALQSAGGVIRFRKVLVRRV
jgi:Domain of Unknown Function (DUF1080)